MRPKLLLCNKKRSKCLQYSHSNINLTVLPIDAVRREVDSALAKHTCVVLEASPGAGKTTRVPLWALESPWVAGREIWMLSPRRLAVRLAATRLAESLNEEIGQTVGYQFRFESKIGPKTRLRLMTEGMFLHLYRQDPTLSNVALVILDEFHERHLAADIALAMLRMRQQSNNSELRIMIMSATLQTQSLIQFLPEAKLVNCPMPIHPLRLEYRPGNKEKKLCENILAVVSEALANSAGDILIFLPGQKEIKDAYELIVNNSKISSQNIIVMPLYADMTKSEQADVFASHQQRKIVISTNVAESSITLPGVRIVIDSGLQRISDESSQLGFTTLRIRSCPKSSCIQRAGRAAREAPGICYRLYSESDFHGRPAFDRPEILRRELSETLLQLLALNFDMANMPWFDRPHTQSLERANRLLLELGALEISEGKSVITELGRKMILVNLPVRLSHLWVKTKEDKKLFYAAALLVAMLSDERGDQRGDEKDDLESQWHLVWKKNGLLSRESSNMLQRLCPKDRSPYMENEAKEIWHALLPHLLAAFPDRVAKRVQGNKILLGFGEQAQLQSHWPESELFFLCVGLDETDRGTHRFIFASKIVLLNLDLLLNHPKLEEQSNLSINIEQERLEELSGLYLGKIALLEERRVPRGDDHKAEKFWQLVLKNHPQWLNNIFGDDWWAGLWVRQQLILKYYPDQKWPQLPDATDVIGLAKLLSATFPGAVEIKECLNKNARQIFLQIWLNEFSNIWQKYVPETIAIPGKRDVMIQYRQGLDPMIESRMQDFFSMPEGPSILDGSLPLVISFLAPNYRSVQTTQDLKGFWQRHYPALKKELSRRYPRHFWPNNPLEAPPKDPNRPLKHGPKK